MKTKIESFDTLSTDYDKHPRTVSSSDLDLQTEAGFLVIRIGETDSSSSFTINSMAKTPVKQIARKATVHLSTTDIKALFEFALSQKLVALSVDLPK